MGQEHTWDEHFPPIQTKPAANSNATSLTAHHSPSKYTRI
jgi:hypothetical protein